MAENPLLGFRVRVFGDSDAAGNIALCFVFSTPQSQTKLLQLSQFCDTTVCGCWWYENALHVRCFFRENPVQFCGHGMLACAHVWRERFGGNADASAAFAVIGGRRRCEFRHQRDRWWLRVPHVTCRQQVLPDEVAARFRPMPVKMALAGSQQGYKIFEWPKGTDIAEVHADSVYLSSDARATILTAAADGGLFDFTLRYLAPQYGSDEDAATGSANVVLADYWVQRGLEPPFRARQCSSTGGVIFSDIDHGRVAIGGQVWIEQEIVVDAPGTGFRSRAG